LANERYIFVNVKLFVYELAFSNQAVFKLA